MWRSLLAVALATLLLAAGCAAPQADEPSGQTVSASLSNGDDASYAVRLAVVPGDLDGARVTYANGSTRTLDVADLSALPTSATANATDVEPLGVDVRTERFVLPPNGGVGTTFEDVPDGARLVYVVSTTGADGALRGQGMSRCPAPGGRLDFSLAVEPDGSLDVSTSCAGGAPE